MPPATGNFSGVLKTAFQSTGLLIVLLWCCGLHRAGASENPRLSVRPQAVSNAKVVVAEDVGSITAFSPDAGRVEQLFHHGLVAITG